MMSRGNNEEARAQERIQKGMVAPEAGFMRPRSPLAIRMYANEGTTLILEVN